MKNFKKAIIISLCFIALLQVQSAFADIVIYPEAWCVDSQNRLLKQDFTTKDWNVVRNDVKIVDGSTNSESHGPAATFIITTTGEVYQCEGPDFDYTWVRRFGCYNPRDIATRGRATVFAISESGTQIFHFNPLWDGFDLHSTFPGAPAKTIDVDQSGIPWVGDEAGDIYRYLNNTWELIHDASGNPHTMNPDDFVVLDIGAGGGDVYAVGTYGPVGTTELFKFNGTSFVQTGLQHVGQVEANIYGDVYVLTKYGSYMLVDYKYDTINEFAPIIGKGLDNLTLINLGM